MTQREWDIIVIGSGPAGQKAAIQAAKLKQRVLLVEADQIGGSCLHLGTIPSKTLREATLSYAGQCNESALLGTVISKMRAVISEEQRVILSAFERNNVSVKLGKASFASSSEVKVTGAYGEEVHRAAYVIVTVGTRPFRDADLVYDSETIFDSDSILSIKKQPDALLVIGAGVIGCEYASIFAQLGSKVTLLQLLLRTEQ